MRISDWSSDLCSSDLVTTAAAFLAFAAEPADLLLLEVGLGGRLDATNVIDKPRLTAITPIALDHQQFLGTTLEAIAGEKAGIMKPGVTCGVGQPEPGILPQLERPAQARAGPPFSRGPPSALTPPAAATRTP